MIYNVANQKYTTNKQVKEDIENLKNNNEIIEKDIESLKNDDENIKEDIENLKNNNEIIKEDIEILKNHNVDIKEDIENLKNNDVDIKEDIETVTAVLNNKADKQTEGGGFIAGEIPLTEDNKAYTGVSIGKNAKTYGGINIGEEAHGSTGAVAIGKKARSTMGASIGDKTHSNSGGAIGYEAFTTSGGSIGYNSFSGRGFSGGESAQVAETGNNLEKYIDAIQLGTGTNTQPNTLQVYNYQLMDAEGKIPNERLKEVLTSSSLYQPITILTPTDANIYKYRPNYSGYYKVFCIGKGGHGGRDIPDSSGRYFNTYGGGGGAVSFQDLYLSKEQEYSYSVSFYHDSYSNINNTQYGTYFYVNENDFIFASNAMTTPLYPSGTAAYYGGDGYYFINNQKDTSQTIKGENGKTLYSTSGGVTYGGSCGKIIPGLSMRNMDGVYSLLNLGNGQTTASVAVDNVYATTMSSAGQGGIIIIPIVLEK